MYYIYHCVYMKESLPIYQSSHTGCFISPPRKLRSKNPKVSLNLWQKLRKKFGKVAPMLRAILHIFGCKILLWSFGTLTNLGNEQQYNISILYFYTPNEVQKLDIFGNKVFVHVSDMLYCKLRCNIISLATPAQWHRE